MEEAIVRSNRPRLGSRLRELRRGHGISGTELATQLGVAQSTVSKIECGRLTPDIGYLSKFAYCLRLPADDSTELFSLAGVIPPDATPEAFLRFVPFELRSSNWVARRQDTIGMAEQRADRIRVFQPQLVPGLLQTAAYAECVVMAAGVRGFKAIERAVAARLRRQERMAGRNCKLSFLITEAALRTRLGKAEVMHDQLQHLLEVVQSKTRVQLGIIPLTVLYPSVPPPGFQIFDERVYIELPHGDLWLLERSGSVEKYLQLFTQLREVALFGPAAEAKLQQLLRLFHPQRRALN